jgi:hypothetical protein
MLAAPQLYATLEYGRNVLRAPDDLSLLLGGRFPLRDLPLLALPRIAGDSKIGNWQGFGNENEIVAYVGLLTLFLAPLALVRIRQPAVQALLAIEILAWAIALGTPVYHFLYHVIPGVNQLRATARATSLHAVALPCLAAIGLDVGLDHLVRSRSRRRATAYIVLVAVAVLAFAVLLHAYPRGLFSQGYMLRQYAGLLVPSGAGLVLAGIAILQPRRAPACAWLLAPVVALDLWIPYGRYNTASVGPAPLSQSTAVTDFLRSHKGRFVAFQADELTGDTPIAYRIESLEGYQSAIVKNYGDLFNQIENQGIGLRYSNAVPPLQQKRSLDSPILDLLGVRWVLTQTRPQALQGVSALAPAPRLVAPPDLIYERPNALAPVTAVCLRPVGSEGDVLRQLAQEKREEIGRVALSTETVAGVDCTSVGDQLNAALEWSNIDIDGRVQGTIRSHTASVVRVTETYYPGWRASVDGRPVPVLRLDHALLGAAVGKGTHRFSFSFHQDELGLTLPIAALAGLMLLAAAAIGLKVRT